MLRKFDEGKRDDFFSLWQQYVPASMLGLDFGTQKFEFYLQVYFSIYPVLPSSSVLVVTPGPGSRLSSHPSSSRHELALRMKAFKQYLEGRGAGLAHTAEFLPYYALPYVPQPEHHPSFEGLFQARWVDEQRLHLKAFLEDLSSKSANHVPLLYVMYAEHLQATDGVPRLSPRARALRASTRAHPYSQSREGSRGSVGHGGLGLSSYHPHHGPPGPGMRSSGGGPALYASGAGGGILGQYDNTTGAMSAGASPSPGRRARGPGLPPRSRPVSGLEGRHGACSAGGAATVAAAAAALPPKDRTTRAVAEGDDDTMADLFEDDDEEGTFDGEEDAEEQARAVEVLRRQREAEEAEMDEAVEAAMEAALRSPTNGDLPPARKFPQAKGKKAAGAGKKGAGAGPAEGDSVRSSIALSLERLGLAEDAVFRDSVQLLGSTLGGEEGGTLDADMVSELMAAGAAVAAAGAAAAAEAAAMGGSPGDVGGGLLGDGRRSSSCTGLAPLDYRKVKKDLAGPDMLLAARLLQALRWRLTRSCPGADRWGLIASWIEVDLLDCHSPSLLPPPHAAASSAPASPSGQPGGDGSSDPAAVSGPVWSLLRHLAASADPRVVEETARLANAIASDRLGRNYLMLPGGGAVPALMGVLQTAPFPGAPPAAPAAGAEAEDAAAAEGSAAFRDGPAVQQALVGLQKLSLKRAAQSQMVRAGAVGWVVAFLGDLATVSPVAVEYGTALLMNLCLRSAGRAAAAAVAVPLLQLCEDLLTCSNDQVRTYIHGTLYSVFGRASIREVAAQRHTAALLEEVAQAGQAPFAAQSQYILRQLYMPDAAEDDLDGGNESADEAAPDGDADMEAEEGGEDAYADVDITPESLLSQPGELCGEPLLCAGYLASSREAREHLTAVRSSVATAAALMAAAGKTTLRGSVLLGSLPRPGSSAAGGGAWGRGVGRGAEGRSGSGPGGIGEEGEEDVLEEAAARTTAAPPPQPAIQEGEEVEDEVGDGGPGRPAGGTAAAAANAVFSEPSSTAPSGAGDDNADDDEEEGYEDDYEEYVAGTTNAAASAAVITTAAVAAGGAEGAAPYVTAFAAGEVLAGAEVQGSGGEDRDGLPPPEDASSLPSPGSSPPGPSGEGSRRGSVRLGSRAGEAAGGGGGSLRPSTSSSAYVTLATSTASTSIIAAARALEAARLSNGAGTLGPGGTLSVGGGGDGASLISAAAAAAAAASGNGSLTASSARRRSSVRPLTPSLPGGGVDGARSSATGGMAAGVGARALRGSSSGESGASGTGAAIAGGGPEDDDPARPPPGFRTSGVGPTPPRPPSQGPGGGPLRPPAPPALTTSGSLEGASSQSGGRAGSRPQSPFRAGRGSLVSSARRRTSEGGSQLLASSPVAAAVAGAGGAADGPDGMTRGRSSLDPSAAGPPVPGARSLRRSVSASGDAAVDADGGGPLDGSLDPEARGSQGRLPPRASLGAPPPPISTSSSRPGMAGGSEGGRRARPSSPAPHGAVQRMTSDDAAAAASPSSSISASPSPGVAGPAPHHINTTRHPPHHPGGRAGGPHRPNSVQGQPFPITAASSQTFDTKPPDGGGHAGGVVVSLRTSQTGSSAAGTPRDGAPSPAGSAAAPPDGSPAGTPTRSRSIPRPPLPTGTGAEGGGSGPLPSPVSRVPSGSGKVEGTRHPTPPSGRGHARSRMGPAPPVVVAAASPAGASSGPATPGGTTEGELEDMLPPPPPPPPPDLTASSESAVFGSRRQLPRTPSGA